MWVVPWPCLVCAVATPGWGPGGWRYWRLFAGPAGVRGDADGEGAVGDILCWGRGGDRGDFVGDVSWLLSFRVTLLAGVVGMVLWVLGLAGDAEGEGVAGDTWWLALLVLV